ncbi:MAG: hypothetical protein V3S69_01610 [Dehalococcoidales bacterium]
MITTIYGEIPVDQLRKKEDLVEDSDKIIKTTEYWLGDVLVKRSVHAHLKQNVFAVASAYAYG